MKKRDYGIDLLRMVSMGLIVLHHLLNHGALLFAFPTFSTSGMAVHLMNAFTRSAVNAYALISGYVMVSASFRPSRMIGMWLQVAFYGALAVLFLPLMAPGTTPGAGDWLDALLPVTHENYWYFTCYVPVFMLSPALNQLLRSMSRKQAGTMMTTALVLFTILPLVALGDVFQITSGFHFVWLMVLYLLGGCLRLHGFGRLENKWLALTVFVICSALGWGSRLGIIAMGASKKQELLLNYNAPTMLLCGIALLSLFKELKLPAWLQKAIAVLSPLTFGVYLIHDNPLVRKHLIVEKLMPLANRPFIQLLLMLAACWAAVYAVCLLIEWLRTKLFALLHIPEWCIRLDKRLNPQGGFGQGDAKGA